jgi:hypothetical protein
VLVFWAAGEACLVDGVTLDISISVDGYAGLSVTAHADSAIRDGVSETATFAN